MENGHRRKVLSPANIALNEVGLTKIGTPNLTSISIHREVMQSDAMALPDEVLPIARNGISQKDNANLAPHVDIRLREN